MLNETDRVEYAHNTADRQVVEGGTVARMQRIFLVKSHERLAEMNRVFLSGGWSAKIKETLISHSFSLKGEGISLGYQLLARTADSLCQYCEKTRVISEENRVVIAKHLETIQVVLDNEIHGEGGEIGKALFDYLLRLIAKMDAQKKV
jgi:hypothetical protein